MFNGLPMKFMMGQQPTTEYHTDVINQQSSWMGEIKRFCGTTKSERGNNKGIEFLLTRWDSKVIETGS